MVLVVSPLVSLMSNQVITLRESGVGAAFLSGNKGIDSCFLSTVKDIKSGSHRFLFSAPEAIIDSHCWRELLLDHPLCNQIIAIVIDEAHCVFKWSQDFRFRIELRALVPSGVPMMALTATVTKLMLADIKYKLNMPDCHLVYLSPDRPNICYEVKERTSIEEDFACVLQDICYSSFRYGSKF